MKSCSLPAMSKDGLAFYFYQNRRNSRLNGIGSLILLLHCPLTAEWRLIGPKMFSLFRTTQYLDCKARARDGNAVIPSVGTCDKETFSVAVMGSLTIRREGK